MKHLKKITVALVLFVAATGFINAQSKIAHIDWWSFEEYFREKPHYSNPGQMTVNFQDRARSVRQERRHSRSYFSGPGL